MFVTLMLLTFSGIIFILSRINKDRVLFYALFKDLEESKLNVVKKRMKYIFTFVFTIDLILLVINFVLKELTSEIILGLGMMVNLGSLLVMCVNAYRLYNKFYDDKISFANWYTVIWFLDNKSFENTIHSLSKKMKMVCLFAMLVIFVAGFIFPTSFIMDGVIGVRIVYTEQELKFGYPLSYSDNVSLNDIVVCEEVDELPPLSKKNGTAINNKYLGSFDSIHDDDKYRLYVEDSTSELTHIFDGSTHYYFNSFDEFKCK